MAAAAQKSKSTITVRGSADIVCDYLNFSINSILYQRGLYPPESFSTEENYGVTMFMSTDKKIQEFVRTTLNQLKEWLVAGAVTKITLVITNVKTLEVMERWDFNVEYEGETGPQGDDPGARVGRKPLDQIKREIRDVMKQIFASISFLPLLDCLCGFDIQICTVNNVPLPSEWSEAEPSNIKNAQKVKIRSFSTDIHKMNTVVTYKNED